VAAAAIEKRRRNSAALGTRISISRCAKRLAALAHRWQLR
jgi:hypothetical protein